ncbi:unnamed protein product [Polarella glacialis]|uniref:NAD-dependent epimerase/dehydratase domain-containing protein n=1 Tax=Polarella glacialis TaxID=89957 RepID=A0A813I1F9_POLGL|nr:unnamed protein product [Polarella glacialis]
MCASSPLQCEGDLQAMVAGGDSSSSQAGCWHSDCASLTGRACLVTGATGFVGRNVVDALLRRSARPIYCLCRPGRPLPPGWGDAVRRIEGDMESVETLEAAITESQCEVIFNLAGLYAWWAPDNGSFRRANVDSVRNLLAAITNVQSDPAPRSRPKLIHVSTVLAYGRTSGGLTPETAFTEASPAGPCSSAYAASKAEGDRLALAAFQAREVSGCILYLACCLGADHKLVDPRRDVMRIAS